MTNEDIRISYYSKVRNVLLEFIYVQVEIEGLTGEIRFNDDGRRQNYTLHVVEMTVNSAMVKVSLLKKMTYSILIIDNFII